MHMGFANPGGSYMMDGVTLEEIEQEKDLGVYITNDCKPSTQCTKAAQKAMNSLRVIKRTFKHFDQEAFQIIYRTYIRPHLEYCVPTWNPGMRKDISILEKVQRRATKLVPELKELQYEERLEALGLFTIETRRLRGDLIETYKIIHGFEKVNAEKFFKMADVEVTRGHDLKIFKPRMVKGLRCRQEFFSKRVIDEWNKLPPQVVNAPSINSFKSELENH